MNYETNTGVLLHLGILVALGVFCIWAAKQIMPDIKEWCREYKEWSNDKHK